MMNFFEHLKGFFSNKTAYSKGLYDLFKLEAKLAGLNLYPLLISIIILFVFVITFWTTLMILVGFCTYLFTKQPLISLIMILLINLCLAYFLLKDIKIRLEQMSFSRTRTCMRMAEEGTDCESTEERAVEIHHRNGKEG